MKNASGGREAAKGLFEREYHSDENQILDSLTRIERKAEYAAKRFGTNIDYIYDALDFDPISYQLDSRNDSWLKETEQYAMEAMQKIAVPAQHGNYGGKNILADFIADDNAIFGFFEKSKSNPAGAGGEVVERKEIVLKEEIEYVDKLIGWVDKHKKLTAAAIIGSLGFGAAVKYKTDRHFADDVDSGISKAKAEISAGASGVFVGFGDYFNDAPVASLKIDTPPDKRIAGEKIVFNASGSYDTDGKITEYKWIFLKDGKFSMETTPTPVLEKTLNEGKTDITLNVVDDKGKAGAAGYGVNVKKFPEPEKPFIMYKNTKIRGNPLFQENVVKVLEFLNKFSPSDYQPLMEDVNLIDLDPSTDTLRGGGGGIFVNLDSVLNKQINKSNSNYIKLFAEAFRHEWGHTYVQKIPGLSEQFDRESEKICGSKIETASDMENCTKKLGKNDYHEWHPSETYPDQFRQSALRNLSYVTPAMIDKFNEDFNFSEVMSNQ